MDVKNTHSVTKTDSVIKTEISIFGSSAGSILDILKYRDTCERSISILGGIAILRYIEYIE